MNAKTLAELALKIWGIILAISALASLPVTLLMAATASGGGAQDQLIRLTQRASILSVVIQAAVGTAVVVWADRITNLIESDTAAAIKIDADIADLQRLGFGLVGVFFLVGGLQNAASAAYVLVTKPTLEGTDALIYTWDRQKEAIIKGFVEVIAGVPLVFGRQAIADGWSRLRGQSKADDDDDLEDDAG